jgi:phosphohistidine phosphatase
MALRAMKRLFLVRHAKSSWDEPELADALRPLNARGRRVASKLGSHLIQQGYRPDAIVHSSAVRAQQTANALFAALTAHATESGLQGPERVESSDLYLACVDEQLSIIWGFSDSWSDVLMVGHNPGLHDLVGELSGESPPRFPTGAVAIVEFPHAPGVQDSPEPGRWTAVQANSGRLRELWLPKALGF